MSLDPSWRPAFETIVWAAGHINEEAVATAIREDVARRGQDLSGDSDDYWRLIGEAAVEAVVFDLVEEAKRWGTEFPSSGGPDSPGQ
ncbi:hypothetical protein [Saccharopolyspora phatthalungensis]|uniref:Uncharacterized protein n=1 Tax=Saccharopolyspora phatthalungensis TaxID=664693 RepID=A0A840QAZ3_9PSEU|nr:hypothetical protein [Saccharopolyspora phatthalungensis]MBB5159712.1 hypothetical protein [Saccharopolyspora phatthalungensis]